MAGRTVDDRLHALHIGLPGTIGAPVRVRDLNAKGHALVAKLALSHPLHLLAVAYFRAAFHKHNWYHNRKNRKKQAKFSKKCEKFWRRPDGENRREGVAKTWKFIYNKTVLPSGKAKIKI
jgi:hypothetical protein